MKTHEQNNSTFSKMIPNPQGLPMHEKDSPRVEEAHSYWREESQKSSGYGGDQLEYWQKVSVSRFL